MYHIDYVLFKNYFNKCELLITNYIKFNLHLLILNMFT